MTLRKCFLSFTMVFWILPTFATETAAEADKDVRTYFACSVEEPHENSETKTTTLNTVTVKFVVKNLDLWPNETNVNKSNVLENYPGASEDSGAILVTPEQLPDESYTRMSNLNGQGGDLRIEDSNLRLFGDGDGYQFTDLILWDIDQIVPEGGQLEGYVRNYGQAYNGETEFKQFIKCTYSNKQL